ncbi:MULTISPECIES: FAD/NAD(P)-dependent oxidoreductase [Rhizobium]|uniref:NAD(P)/FAD-dependent oxidoreductase n=1 Tax=Rhizobium tropici TaxID=398 RepID=A0A6P1CGA8_RHITR|nr:MULTISPECIES: FAD/NAD(P)-binding oxidoreductase [Rhizobium]AGB75469.1 opine oxidase subunit A (octopine oxidase subunit A) [Rhizobium tropici CIAT 899]MBB4241842.1 NADPH-dependent 2,4-dienoyl-CoA reductase/sulfur reductase-like enzyme [Rhizobium tropici]MBB5593511.1 NADPH-dependent 2,4-dienoyl-CoA reductase/sulfur reductase-like enzyme [Rhizobium tropici]MBB6492167.1 NADPH-dependent 2,4-dienoyl-CoA reductase/sulfur reductase-like enzyme [Rhizobium tropici]NEV13844.1 NAD(P)/FAD-dependent oxi
MTVANDRKAIVIVGAGPAGIRAAELLVAAGIRPVVIDEGMRAGGQIYRRPPEGFTRSAQQLYGSEAGKALALHSLFDRMVARGEVEYHPQSSAMALAANVLQVLTSAGRREVAYNRLILATGATDRLVPLPGWQAPGVYSLGAAQIALKAQGVALGRRIVLAGSGPLLTLVAIQLVKAGANVAAVLDTSSVRNQILALPDMMARPVLVLRGLAMRLKLGLIYHAGVTLTDIVSDESGPTAVRWRDADGRDRHTECDMVGIGWHLRAETQLAGLAQCSFDYDPGWAQWLPQADRMGRSADGVYLAGDGLRILGADGAEVAGRLAASACLADMGLPYPNPARDLRRLARYERFARAIARAFPWPAGMVRSVPDETMVCRCEGISAGDLRGSVDYTGGEANRVKSVVRVGMGRCQGRFCQLAGAELIAERAGIPVREVGSLREQAPVRPLPIGAWINES